MSVPLNLCAGIPDAASDEAAAFTAVGAIALQGIRLVQPTLDEAVVVTGLELLRDAFFKKELSFKVSASYGPGRYDPKYEEKGHDYPVGFVRWTEQRNFEAVLDMMADGRLDLAPLVSHRFALDQVDAAYAVAGGREPSLGIMLEYPTPAEKPDAALRESTVRLNAAAPPAGSGQAPAVAFVGSGNYATGVLIPAFKAARANLKSVASSVGVIGVHAGKKYGFEKTTTTTAGLFGRHAALARSVRSDGSGGPGGG